MKRSHYACDQCRRSKRGCDAPPLLGPASSAGNNRVNGDYSAVSSPASASEGDHKSCSYCAKTNKTCTMNWAWSQIQAASILSAVAAAPPPPPPPRQASGSFGESADARVKRERLGSAQAFDDKSVSSMPRQANTAAPYVFQQPDAPGSRSGFSGLHTVAHPSVVAGPSTSTSAVVQANYSTGYAHPTHPQGRSANHLPLSMYTMQGSRMPNQYNNTLAGSQLGPTNSQSPADDAWSRDESTRIKRRRTTSTWAGRRTHSLSPFSVDQTMMTNSNNQFISTNLLQIYHDVLEHNLSCWLTEVTCPYRAPGYITGGNYAPTEWGSSWSNRIYRRTINLDHAISTSKLTRLTHSENQASAKALQLSIMAFATQWAQGSRRQRQSFPADDETPEDILDDITEEFDRNIQRNIWEQAKRALQDVADIESYRVATAELIFGLTQKPWTHDDEPDRTTRNHNPLSTPRPEFDMKSLNAELGDIISRDGLPVFMERAARKMHALKFRFDSGRRGVTGPLTSPKNSDALSMMNPEDRGTVGLLYWLAVMLDTVSSSMSERPVVVADADSQHDDADDDLDATTNGRWNVPLFIQDSLEQPHMYHAVHWPCSYESAAEAVTKSAPVKVLLFRHISYLQNILRRGGRGKRVEETIANTTSLYRYWNMTHGAFFKELLRDYESVPGRLQSWFVCISAHWNLGALMLADLIEYVDENEIGETDASYGRLSSKMVTKMRESSAKELSELARVSTPSQNLTSLAAPQMSHFHHAVSEATILTEPWTILLIRAFAKATMVFLQEAKDYLEYGPTASTNPSSDFQESMHRAQDCIKGLWILGKKSDMARKSADTLAAAMRKLRL
ncbi:Regulatory protein alcR [Fusarium culmorum]|uniref:Regulatory protein alcR n=1 Tax=Fusarium culmorum TaxID=5516 RepID=A0A2T4H0I6_FUSCU|nr:Regulatory protein alcR [Fusarium culmorum]